MKEIFVMLAILFSFTIESTAQYNDVFRDKPPGAIYLLFQPTDLGFGLRGDYHINYWAGVYGSASYGTWGLFKNAYLKDHFKLTIGTLIPLKRYLDDYFDISVGLNYHHVEKIISPDAVYWAGEIVYKPWSFEIGWTAKLKRVTIAVRTDILRWEPCIDIGIPIRPK